VKTHNDEIENESEIEHGLPNLLFIRKKKCAGSIHTHSLCPPACMHSAFRSYMRFVNIPFGLTLACVFAFVGIAILSVACVVVERAASSHTASVITSPNPLIVAHAHLLDVARTIEIESANRPCDRGLGVPMPALAHVLAARVVLLSARQTIRTA
jgi:hypothetical protein